METIKLDHFLKARFEKLRNDIHEIIENGPNSEVTRGVLELELYKRPSLKEKIKYLEKEVSIKGLKLNKAMLINIDEYMKHSDIHPPSPNN